MDPHTRFLLTFVLALRRVTRSERSTEIFAFNTALVRLTSWVRPGRVDLTLDRLATQVPDWSGGHEDRRVDRRVRGLLSRPAGRQTDDGDHP